ncbi:hypothetical protein [Negativicoccus succinicivorans]|uniref:hypothetical protein n=1 Tax=Negativicoccus succinicivorans TaxID=620903 RepID=UPI00290CB8AE|nr:hypothetical protein [Negativicoccus succinicivorans]MDU5530413.1 hypothetical protein [Negativicoccus succinicivorans]
MDRVALLVRSKVKSHTAVKLFNKLSDIWDDSEFILGALVILKTDAERQKLLNIIEKETITDPSEIVELELDIADGYI